jgi:hypothetical protein
MLGETLTALVAIVSIFIAFPAILFGAINSSKKNKTKLLAMEHEREMLELEIEKEQVQLKLLEAENKKYDKLINES